MHLRFLLILLAGLLLAMVSPVTPAAWAQPAAAAAKSADLDLLIRTIEDDARRAELLKALRQAQGGTAAAPAEGGFGERLVEGVSRSLAQTADAFASLGRILADVPRRAEQLIDIFSDPVRRTALFLVVGQFLLVFVVALAVDRWAVRPLRLLIRRDAARGHRPWLWRIPPLLIGLLLDLIPSLVLVGVASLLVPAIGLKGSPRLAAIALVSAAAVTGVVMAVANFFLAPQRDDLRLLPVTGETASYLSIWIRRFAAIAIFGYALVQALGLLGIDRGAQLALLRILGFIVAVLAVLFVLQNRTSVRNWMEHGPATGATLLGRQARARFGEVWHIVAILYVCACFFIWAADTTGGLSHLVRATFLTGVVAGVAALAMRVIDFAARRMFEVSDEVRARHPGLEARANRYLPLLQRVLRTILGIVALLVILQAWGLDVFAWLIAGPGQRITRGLLTLAVVLFGAIVLWEIANAWIERYLQQAAAAGAPLQRSARAKTLLPLLRNALMVTLIVICALIALSEIGVNIAPLLAGAGVVGLAIGVGAQKLVQDVITGFFLLVEDALAIGDVVSTGAHSGVVEGLTIRSMRLRDFAGTVHTIPFSSVDRVSNMSKDFSYAVFNVSVTYASNIDKVMATLRTLGDEMRADPEFQSRILGPMEISGLDQFAESGVVIQARIMTRPLQQWSVTREFNKRMKKRFEETGIEMPYRTVTVHVEKGADAGDAAAAGAAAAAQSSK
jgi:small conductance mechanosensitive channel